MANLTFKESERQNHIILGCVPKEGKGRTWTEIWRLAKVRGVGSKGTFSRKFKALKPRLTLEDNRFTRDPFYELPVREEEVRAMFKAGPEPMYTEKQSLTYFFTKIQNSYALMLAKLIGINSREAAMKHISLFLEMNVDPPLQRYAELYYKDLQKNPALRRVAQSILNDWKPQDEMQRIADPQRE